VTAARLAAGLAAALLVAAASGCGGGTQAAGGDDTLYSAEQVRQAFERVGMETVASPARSVLVPAWFATDGLTFLHAAIRDPSGTVLLRYDVQAGIYASVEGARAALPRAVGDEPTRLVRRFHNVIVAVTGVSFRPTSLPPELVAAIRRVQTGEEWSEQG
jgi:hypothetical protein